MEKENNGLGFMILKDTNIFEATDFDALVKEKMLSTIPSEKVAIEMLVSFDVAITEFIEGMKREKAILEEMIANGEFKKRDSENSDLDKQISEASQFDHGEREEKKEEEEEERDSVSLESAIAVIEGLISYHKRMTLPIVPCTGETCPAVEFENNVYLSALEESLRLLRRELEGLNQLSGLFHT